VLAIVCRTEKNHGNDEKPFYPVIFPSAESVASLLSTDETAVLFNCWRLVQNKWGPFERTAQTKEETSEWIKRLVEGAAEHPLGHLSLAHLVSLTSSLALRAYILHAVLESLHSSLPSTLKSRLASFSVGTSSFGLPAPSTFSTGTGTFQNLRVLDVDITVEDAGEMTMKMKDAESAALAFLDEAEAAARY
jgi:hypothetical protein